MQVTVSPARFMLASGKGISLTVRCQLQPGSSGGEMEGHLEVWNARGGVPVRVPTYCSISASESGRTLKVSTDGIVAGAFATVQGALGVARAGDVIEIADDEAYFETIVIGMGQDGRPLDGLVLRGTSTPKAALDGSQAAAHNLWSPSAGLTTSGSRTWRSAEEVTAFASRMPRAASAGAPFPPDRPEEELTASMWSPDRASSLKET